MNRIGAAPPTGAQRTLGAPQGSAAGYGPPPQKGSSGRVFGLLFGLASALVVALIIANGMNNQPDRPEEPTPTAAPSAAAPVPLNPRVSSFATTGGGFRQDDEGIWDTSTYNNVNFGGLKPGVGLVLDLGEARELATVDFSIVQGPLRVELRAADQISPTLEGWTVIAGTGPSEQPEGEVSLNATEGGENRYWMIWVSQLGPDRKAIISDVSATG